MPGNINKTQTQVRVQVEGRKTQIDGNSAPLLFLQAIRIDSGETLDQRGLAMIDVAGGSENDVLQSAGRGRTPAAVEEVNHEADRQPDEETNPREQRESHHQQQTAKDRQDRDEWNERDSKRARALGLRSPQHNDAVRYHNKRKECTDVGKLGKRVDVPQP